MSMETPSKRQHRHTRSAATASHITSNAQYSQTQYSSTSHTSIQHFESDASFPPSTPPRTPRRKSPSAGQSKSNPQLTDGGGKSKNRNKHRPKNVNTSPAVTRSDRQTPPLNSAGLPQSTTSRPITTPSSTAYAGPTFHASPAPSTLPIPSFYSKSVPESPAARLLLQKQESSHSRDIPSDPMLAIRGEVSREESPLDFFFKLDREEKARARSASSTQQPANSTGPFPAPSSPKSSQTPPANNRQTRQTGATNNRFSGGGMFPFEMDSPVNSRTPYGPAFSTPYNERINAARSSGYPSIPLEHSSPVNTQSTDRSALLKDYLFNGNPPSAISTSAQSTQAPQQDFYNRSLHRNPNASVHTPRNTSRSSGLRQEVTPTRTPSELIDRNISSGGSPTPLRQYRQQNHPINQHISFHSQFTPTSTSASDVQSTVPAQTQSANLNGLESHLRKILNLESNADSARPQV